MCLMCWCAWCVDVLGVCVCVCVHHAVCEQIIHSTTLLACTCTSLSCVWVSSSLIHCCSYRFVSFLHKQYTSLPHSFATQWSLSQRLYHLRQSPSRSALLTNNKQSMLASGLPSGNTVMRWVLLKLTLCAPLLSCTSSITLNCPNILLSSPLRACSTFVVLWSMKIGFTAHRITFFHSSMWLPSLMLMASWRVCVLLGPRTSISNDATRSTQWISTPVQDCY